jgi:hypothetical protein
MHDQDIVVLSTMLAGGQKKKGRAGRRLTWGRQLLAVAG